MLDNLKNGLRSAIKKIVSSSGNLRLVTDSWFNFTFAITNATEDGKATSWVWNHSQYNGSSVMLYQNNMGAQNETASLSGNLSWLQSLRLDDDGSGELADFKINHMKPVKFKVGAVDDTEYEEDYAFCVHHATFIQEQKIDF